MTDRDRILQKTNGGFDVFVHYMGEECMRKLFRNPFRDDSNPSCHLYYHADSHGGEGRYVLKDFGDSLWCGDCFWLVSRLCHLDLRTDFKEIIRVIDKELNIYVPDGAPVRSRPVMEKVRHGRVGDHRPVQFAPEYRNFNKYELSYWASYGITLPVLKRYNVRSLSSCCFERADGTSYNIYGTLDVPMFGYVFSDGAGIKVYRPHAGTGRFMYAGMLPRPYVFGWGQLSFRQHYVIVTGGEKDVMSLSAHGFDAVCLNSETARLPHTLLMQLAGRYKSMVFLYDCDETGRRESALRSEEWNRIMRGEDRCGFMPACCVTLPLSGSRNDKDVSDFFQSGYHGSQLHDLILSAIQHKDK